MTNHDKRNCVRKRILCVLRKTLIITLIAAVLAGTALAANPLGVSRIKQSYSKWCWAACCQMMGYFVTPTTGPSQAAVVYNIFGNYSDSVASDAQIVTSLNFAVNKASYQANASTFSTVKGFIDSGRAMIFKITWTSGGGNHAVICDGYNSTGSTVRLIDPWESCATTYYGYDALLMGTAIQSGTGYLVKYFYHST